MARPGFYNDNEYRVYPFVYRDNLVELPDATIVDVGLIMGLDCEFDDLTHAVWLHQIAVSAGVVTVTLKTNANPAPLAFSFPATVEQWTTVYAESVPATSPCAEEPIWSGFIVVGRLAEMLNLLTATPTKTFPSNQYQVEPARIQNLNKAYVRSISVGNYSRVTVPPCDDAAENLPIDLAARQVIPNRTCMKGPILFKEGYNCLITQTDRDRSITVTAAKGNGAQEDSTLCEAGGEIPLFADEQPAVVVPANGNVPEVRSKFLSGGPACNELIFTINGVGGSNVNIVGGQNIIIRGPSEEAGDSPNTVNIELNSNIQGGCSG